MLAIETQSISKSDSVLSFFSLLLSLLVSELGNPTFSSSSSPFFSEPRFPYAVGALIAVFAPFPKIRSTLLSHTCMLVTRVLL